MQQHDLQQDMRRDDEDDHSKLMLDDPTISRLCTGTMCTMHMAPKRTMHTAPVRTMFTEPIHHGHHVHGAYSTCTWCTCIVYMVQRTRWICTMHMVHSHHMHNAPCSWRICTMHISGGTSQRVVYDAGDIGEGRIIITPPRLFMRTQQIDKNNILKQTHVRPNARADLFRSNGNARGARQGEQF